MALGEEGAGAEPLPPKPAWFTPGRLLALFCSMQLLVYMDRGVIASTGVKGDRAAGTGISGRFQLSELKDGALYSAFIVGLLVGSPLFAEAAKYHNPFKCISFGLFAWVLATMGCALSTSFGALFLCRCLVGLGEASFCSLASPFIDDASPPATKTRWLACFFMCIPVGVALGFIFGKVVGDAAGWRAPFALNSLFMVPFVVFCYVSTPLALRGSLTLGAWQMFSASTTRRTALVPAASFPRHNVFYSTHRAPGLPAGADARSKARSAARSFASDASSLLRLPVVVAIAAAWAAHTAVVGTYQYYGPKAAKALFKLDSADTVFGALTVATGIAGTLIGGSLLDKRGATVAASLRFCAAACAASFALLALSFTATRLPLFVVLFGAGELALFSVNACVNAATLWSVPLRLRSLAMSGMTVAIHVFGRVAFPSFTFATGDCI